jgi:hypothetical protein
MTDSSGEPHENKKQDSGRLTDQSNIPSYAIGDEVDVRFGSLADMCSANGHVRFTPNGDRET